jgi:hypothetical protein
MNVIHPRMGLPQTLRSFCLSPTSRCFQLLVKPTVNGKLGRYRGSAEVNRPIAEREHRR